jgi:prolyl-tRNA editing enzyme YbaK/EbsC (Cys-tRNA(Pro) deacylase)
VTDLANNPPDDAAAKVLATLQSLGIEHEVMDCDPELADTAVFCAHYNIPPEVSANVIIAAGKSDPRQYAACVLLATTRLDVNKCVRKKMGVKKCSFASADETKALTGMEIGGVTALGLPESLPLWIDSKVMQCDYIILGGGSRSIKIRISPAVFDLTPNTEIVEGLALEAA